MESSKNQSETVVKYADDASSEYANIRESVTQITEINDEVVNHANQQLNETELTSNNITMIQQISSINASSLLDIKDEINTQAEKRNTLSKLTKFFTV